MNMAPTLATACASLPPEGALAPRGGPSALMTHGTALIMAGGTGGHIFPGLALAHALRERGWRVHWLGGAGTASQPSMESQLVPPQGFAFESIDFSGVRGKGLGTLVRLPWRLLRACWQSVALLRRVQPDVVLGLGGYITLPAGLMSVLLGKALILHEQNSVAGMANKVLARFATRVFTAFPDVLPNGHWVGNPLRAAFLQVPDPATRFAGRAGPLKLLVLGGSLGARALNDIVPRALALLPPQARPIVTHQSGARQIDALRANYAGAGVQAELTPFIDDTAQAMAGADLVLCRAGASTVTEIAAVGAAALFVPFPSAVDDHQTSNARFLVDQGAGWLKPQSELSPEWLADMLQKTERIELMGRGLEAKKLQKLDATHKIVAACEEVVR
ncbi:UDP-N-acetylglucosamine--N-acetylmuramyl-(pentapeptide) pyrophosphoryl-undecaprenol N-acetylglucosamine transferase [Rhodoferax ferrireducens T118]|uniref:UDP-N-acetylglucosamine--N-acetylmuramyl-(pentapeptide) pyrophosphoryl-undecaprenol N-acetylglucosamine transferase n=2 Tax=Rhodoferax ferrireducens TaxID=192843 RepID=MURG_ALBFT|nr:RecName: Full=UDP-N-acetylglucosamine--N-acetylmuramyl-(pentapeptide) pyrophosphoryl-undecaprenol N-acetylglucosamine transferase; AltName: Full=Undecaprenyl-PP-MurNAc-pentapeptide-UDPGlcNAc GlcNAc transferase [Rhodoferax ferrireducens T118]ABD71134.1 UDP-N-acetylglucosamine--N-acetylmuramyl-(pentapeptide) pyrophosphoryl-undecaprenol N-acetylglucosamine transferase [Rhodoferax ferrireducens T118]